MSVQLLNVVSDFVDDLAGGDVMRKLQRTPQYEVIQANTHDRMMMTVEVRLISEAVWLLAS